MKQDQKTINELWNKGSDNYNQIIHNELASFRVKGWQKKIAEQIGNREGLKAASRLGLWDSAGSRF